MKLCLCLLVYFAGIVSVSAASPKVLVSIAPIHSLVSAIMRDVGTPELIFSARQSPHHVVLSPSDIRKVHRADLVIMIDSHCFERQFDKMVNQQMVKALNLLHTPGVHRISVQEHAPCKYDAHIWLDPINAIAIVQTVTSELSRIDPAHSVQYAQNRAVLVKNLHNLDNTIATRLSALSFYPYLVYHNAFAYFEARYHLPHHGAVLKNADVKPGIRRVKALREQIVNKKVTCIFIEPQVSPKLVHPLTVGTALPVITLDPLGYHVPTGENMYFQMLESLSVGFAQCFQKQKG